VTDKTPSAAATSSSPSSTPVKKIAARDFDDELDARDFYDESEYEY
jgi:hypothetical protein